MSKRVVTANEKRREKEKRIKIIVVLVVIILLTALSIFFVVNKNGNLNTGMSGIFNWFSNGDENKNENFQTSGDSSKYASVEKNPIVTMEMENGEIIKIELYPKIAPTTVENFISLIKSGFYDGLTFHRVIPDFMAQGGDPKGNSTGDAGYTIFGEFSENGFENNLSHEIGVISMARGEDKNSASSQFFIVTSENSYLSLDGMYAGFGKVIEGMEHVYTIVNSETMRKEYSDELIAEIEANGGQITTEEMYYKYLKETEEITKPVNPPVIEKMTVDTFGYEYDEPQKMK